MRKPAFITCAVALAILGLAQNSRAQETAPIAFPNTQFSSGMVGLALGQTARLNVVNLGDTTPPALACVVALAFADADGQILKQTFVSVAAGKAAFLDFTLSDGALERVQIRAIGYNPPLASRPSILQPLSCNLAPTLELFDTNTGKTTAVLENFTRPANISLPPLEMQP